MHISSVHAIEILDSRGNPTVACCCTLSDGTRACASVPSGASTGKYEAIELRDGDQKRYHGLGVQKAITNVNEKIHSAIKGHDASEQAEIDRLMCDLDGTPNKANLGANAILSVSMSIARAQAVSEKKELFEYLSRFNPDFKGEFVMPLPQMNIINGGKHGNWATDIQEYMILPISAQSTNDAIRMGAEVYQSLKSVLLEKNYPISVGDEGGFSPPVSSNSEPFELLSGAIIRAGYDVGKDFVFGIDAAASEFLHDNIYTLKKENKTCSTDEMIHVYEDMLSNYPISTMEDIYGQDDWEGFRKFTEKHGGDIQVVGDDLYATNVHLLERGITEKSTNAILIKVNQIGTVTETIQAILKARKFHMNSIVSHRSGETEDTFIADLVVAMGTGQIKTGSLARSDRTAKYNRLIAIADFLGDTAKLQTPIFGYSKDTKEL